jgi:predicted outer membrane repeat protein
MRLPVSLVCLGILALASSVAARTWYITPDRTGDAPTIQAGIDSAAAGDTLLLADGTYTGGGNWDIQYKGKPVVISSEGSTPDLCIIECGGHRGFAFIANEGPESVLQGVTVKEGNNPVGGGIYCTGSSPTISNVILSDNFAESAGGGMYCEDASSPVIVNTVFRSNGAMDGGGLYCNGSSPQVHDVEFRGNYTELPGIGGGLVCMGGSSPEVSDVTFIDNSSQTYGGGIACWGNSEPTLTDVLFWGNRAMAMGGGISCGSNVAMTNCTFVLNSSGMQGSAIHSGAPIPPSVHRSIVAFNFGSAPIFAADDDCPELSCCDVFGNFWGDWVGCIAGQYGLNGNFSLDPLFCDTASGDFTLEACSPCLPGNHPDGYVCGGVIGAFGSGCECGATTEPSAWGSIKCMYR